LSCVLRIVVYNTIVCCVFVVLFFVLCLTYSGVQHYSVLCFCCVVLCLVSYV
jgi:hypothetical protein